MKDTVEELLDVAESAMRRDGYHATSYRDLSDALGVTNASIHYYFRQKEDLGVALVDRYAKRFFETLNRNVASAPDTLEKMRAYSNTYRECLAASDQMCLCGMLGSESAGLPPLVADAVRAFFSANIEWVETALPKGGSNRERKARAAQAVATFQGAIMLANSLNDASVFDDAARGWLAGYVR